MTDTITAFAAIGIDLGDTVSQYACIDDDGDVIEEGAVKMTKAAFRRAFSLLAPTVIAIEAGAQSRWVAQLLEELGHDVIVANPRQLPLISRSHRKNDVNDAHLLARLARFDVSLLRPLKHRADREQLALVAIRARDQLVRMRAQAMLCVRGMMKMFGIRLPRITTEAFLDRCMAAVPPELLVCVESLFVVIAQLTGQIRICDERIEEIAARDYPEVQRLRSIPGVGTLTALTFVATVAEPRRFAMSRAVGAWLGLQPRQQQSGSKSPQLGISKAGDPYLRRLLVQCAHSVLRKYGPDTALKRWGLKLCERGGPNAKKRAIVAVARKLAVLLHKLWVSGEQFRAVPA